MTAREPRTTKRLRTAESGAAAIEFAILLPVITLMLFAIVDYGFAMFTKMELSSAIRSGAQYAMASPSNDTNIKSAVVGSTNIGDSSISPTYTISSDDVTLAYYCGEDPSSTFTTYSLLTDATTCTSGTFLTLSVSVAYAGFYSSFLDEYVDLPISISSSMTVRVG
jgi:Flp pilus assembly protein TadG